VTTRKHARLTAQLLTYWALTGIVKLLHKLTEMTEILTIYTKITKMLAKTHKHYFLLIFVTQEQIEHLTYLSLNCMPTIKRFISKLIRHDCHMTVKCHSYLRAKNESIHTTNVLSISGLSNDKHHIWVTTASARNTAAVRVYAGSKLKHCTTIRLGSV